MTLLKTISRTVRTVAQLGFRQSAHYLFYQVALRSGFYHLATPSVSRNSFLNTSESQPAWFLQLPDKACLESTSSEKAISAMLSDTQEILGGMYKPFGCEPHPLSFFSPPRTLHWSQLESTSSRDLERDIKWTWEPARFNWAITLAKAYYLSGDEKYATKFWQYYEEFTHANPTNTGLNWISAQEVALRMITLIVCAHILRPSPSSTRQRLENLALSVADHAMRIPPTISYAKAQNNNHLISEAVSIYSAALFLPHHPQAAGWRVKGLRWFNQAILSQVDLDGTYIQQSCNYHRLMLMLAVWMQLLLKKQNQVLDDQVLTRLAAASQWLAARLDRISGCVPNLGHNDGSHFLPLSNADFGDYRPIVQAASRAFLGRASLPTGAWDDLCLWLDLPENTFTEGLPVPELNAHLILGNSHNWASLRAVRYHARPAHADQLHIDIWHRGVNIAMDAGTFQYNAPSPWENALALTRVHNTLSIDHQEQMTRAGKFLWLDWAQATVDQVSSARVSAIHFGYRRLGVLHRRTLENSGVQGWLITDELLPTRTPSPQITVSLQWLFPDWGWSLTSNRLTLQSPWGPMNVTFETDSEDEVIFHVYRAGQAMLEHEPDPILGWVSPTYGLKLPALSINLCLNTQVPLQIRTFFHTPVTSG